MGANLNKLRELESTTQKAWDWLRKLPDYKRDFRSQEKSIQRGELFQYEVSQKDFEKQEAQRRKTNPFGLSLVEYPQITLRLLKEQKKLRNKWGFYPLVAPKKRYPPCDLRKFIEDFLPYSVGKIFQPANFSILDSYFYKAKFAKKLSLKKPVLPRKLNLEFDYRRTEADIVEEIRRLYKHLKKEYGFKIKRPHLNLLESQYKNFILRQLGKTKKEINVLIFNSDKQSFDSGRKKLERFNKKQSISKKS